MNEFEIKDVSRSVGVVMFFVFLALAVVLFGESLNVNSHSVKDFVFYSAPLLMISVVLGELALVSVRYGDKLFETLNA